MKYTAQEHLEADIADLETDLRCALRDALPEYAMKVKRQLDDKLAALQDIEQPKVIKEGGRLFIRCDTDWERKTLLANRLKESESKEGYFETEDNALAEYVVKTIREGGLG